MTAVIKTVKISKKRRIKSFPISDVLKQQIMTYVLIFSPSVTHASQLSHNTSQYCARHIHRNVYFISSSK